MFGPSASFSASLSILVRPGECVIVSKLWTGLVGVCGGELMSWRFKVNFGLSLGDEDAK